MVWTKAVKLRRVILKMVNINNVPFLYSFMKADANKHKHKPYTTPLPTTKKVTNWKWMEIAKHMHLYTHTSGARERSSEKSITSNTISCTSVFSSFCYVMIVGRCFDIQRAVMLALYCCRGNYDELFYVEWYLRVRSILAAPLVCPLCRSLSRSFFRIFFIIALAVQFLVASYIWLNCRFFSVLVVFYAIWLDSHSCSSFNCILSVDCCFAFEHVE